jgi:hypothetical protein
MGEVIGKRKKFKSKAIYQNIYSAYLWLDRKK